MKRSRELFGLPKISPRAVFVNETTRDKIIGDVTIEDDVLIAPSVVIRADEGSPFFIGKGTNIQDGVTIHALLGQDFEVAGSRWAVWVGSHCSLAHNCIIHGPSTIGKKTFIGFNALVHKSRIGRNCHLHFRVNVEGSVVGDNVVVNSNTNIQGSSVGDNTQIHARAAVVDSKIGPRCRIGIGAIIHGVTLDPGSVVNDGQIISCRSSFSLDGYKDFNREVVDFNKGLCERYRTGHGADRA